ncbi:MAG: hypothetical protein GTN74_07100 [Proteobacteria bacterium]|nr:hypothetical protein [Pseudomonadota bacterium]NIS69404.1 hypothetical protein [Pseudomonadota bacterium]
MKIHHIALVCRSEESSDRFYQDLLGFEKIRSSIVSEELSRGFFGFDSSFRAMTYTKDRMTFEVFVIEEAVGMGPRFNHVGFEVEDRAKFLEKCREMHVEIVEIPKGERIITMIKDFDGNLFEIKEKG